MKSRIAIFLISLALCSPAAARDTPVQLRLGDVIEQGLSSGQLDGSVRFFLEGQHTPAVLDTFGLASTRRKTNAFNKSDAEACRWVALSVLIALQQSAQERGANAVIGITSRNTRGSLVDSEKIECTAGMLMAGVEFRGTYATVAER